MKPLRLWQTHTYLGHFNITSKLGQRGVAGVLNTCLQHHRVTSASNIFIPWVNWRYRPYLEWALQNGLLTDDNDVPYYFCWHQHFSQAANFSIPKNFNKNNCSKHAIKKIADIRKIVTLQQFERATQQKKCYENHHFYLRRHQINFTKWLKSTWLKLA